MNKRQKEVQSLFLDDEEKVIRKLNNQYSHAYEEIEKKAQSLQDDINRLDTMARLATDADEKAKLLSMQQSKIYQKQYQDALKKQIGSVLDNMQVEEFKTISEYLTQCYENGFIGAMYDLQGQGIPLAFPLDQEAMVRAIQLDSKISKGLYTRLGEDVTTLKKKISAQVSRGIATGKSFQEMARDLKNISNIGYNNAVRITRTEGHRIQVQSAVDACYKARDNGADVVKQWDATMDARTRDSHARVDGEIRELDEKFSNGLMFPGDPSGRAEEVIHCRCALLQRARWALDDEELQTLKDRAAYFGLDKTDNFTDYKNKYVQAVETPVDKMPDSGKIYMGNLADDAKLGPSHAAAMEEILKEAPENAKQTWNKYVDRLDVVDAHNPQGKAFYSPAQKGITLNIEKVSKGDKTISRITGEWEQGKKPYYTAFHEFGHNISALMANDDTGNAFADIGDVFKSKKFLREMLSADGTKEKVGYTLTGMLKKEGTEYFNTVFDRLKAEAKAKGLSARSVRKQDAWNEIKQEILANPIVHCSDVSDMWDGISNGACCPHYGHTNERKDYWNYVSVGSEGFAEMYSATVMNPDSVKQIQHYFPNSYELFLEILEKMG